jgi:lipoprotein
MRKGRIVSLIVAILGVLILIACGAMWGFYSHFADWYFDPTPLLITLSVLSVVMMIVGFIAFGAIGTDEYF